MGGDNIRLRGNSSNTFSALAVNNKLIEQDDVIHQIEEQQEEITQLRSHLAEFSVKEARIQTEKNVLEKRIASMHKGLDQIQQDLVESGSKALAFKQDIIEDNIRLGYALQAAQQEEEIFVSSLVPLLAEQSLHPANLDAYSIVSSLRILFKHHNERLAIAEEQLRDSQYQKLNFSSIPPSPELLHMERKNNGENVISSNYLPSILEEQEQEQEPSSSSHQEGDDSGEDEYDDVDYANKAIPTVEGLQILGEPFPGNEIQASGYSTNGTTCCGFEWVRYMQDGSMKYIEGAKHPIYTVTADDLDNHLAVLVQPLDDRKQKGEVVKCYANDKKKITCHPHMLREIEQRVRVGHASFLVFIWRGSLDTWKPAILKIKKSGYRIKLDGPDNGVVVVDDKYAPTTIVNLLAEEPLLFSILGPEGTEQYLCAVNNSTDINSSRDAIVLTMRLFVKRAVDKKLGKKKRRGLFFK